MVETSNPTINNRNIKIIGEVIDIDSDEKKFKEMVDLFLEDKLTFTELMDMYPEYKGSMLKKILRSILRKLN